MMPVHKYMVQVLYYLSLVWELGRGGFPTETKEDIFKADDISKIDQL